MYIGNTNWIHEDIKKEKKDMILGGGHVGKEASGEPKVGNGWWIWLWCTVYVNEVRQGGVEERKRKEVLFDSHEIFLHSTYQLGCVYYSMWKHWAPPAVSASSILSASSPKSGFVPAVFLFSHTGGLPARAEWSSMTSTLRTETVKCTRREQV